MANKHRLAAASKALVIAVGLSATIRTATVYAENHHTISATVIVNGQPRVMASDAATVSELLNQAEITLQPEDQVHPPLHCRTFDHITISINTERTRIETVQTPVPFETVFKRTIRLLPGRRSDASAGTNGLREERVQITSLGDRVIRRKVLDTKWLTRPVPRVVLVGVDPLIASRGVVGVRRSMTMLATKYDIWLGGAGSGTTCTGIRARRGLVAVDPRVIPLGSRLYVEGYGYCVAQDTGGAIKGNRIDLCVETPREADRYGAHRVRVLVLE